MVAALSFGDIATLIGIAIGCLTLAALMAGVFRNRVKDDLISAYEKRIEQLKTDMADDHKICSDQISRLSGRVDALQAEFVREMTAAVVAGVVQALPEVTDGRR